MSQILTLTVSLCKLQKEHFSSIDQSVTSSGSQSRAKHVLNANCKNTLLKQLIVHCSIDNSVTKHYCLTIHWNRNFKSELLTKKGCSSLCGIPNSNKEVSFSLFIYFILCLIL